MVCLIENELFMVLVTDKSTSPKRMPIVTLNGTIFMYAYETSGFSDVRVYRITLLSLMATGEFTLCRTMMVEAGVSLLTSIR